MTKWISFRGGVRPRNAVEGSRDFDSTRVKWLSPTSSPSTLGTNIAAGHIPHRNHKHCISHNSSVLQPWQVFLTSRPERLPRMAHPPAKTSRPTRHQELNPGSRNSMPRLCPSPNLSDTNLMLTCLHHSRPKTLSDVTAQDHTITVLQRTLNASNVRRHHMPLPEHRLRRPV